MTLKYPEKCSLYIEKSDYLYFISKQSEAQKI